MVYKMSNAVLKERKINTYILMVAMPLMTLVFFNFFSIKLKSDFLTKQLLIITAATSLFFILEIYIFSKITLKKIGQITLLYQEDRLIRNTGKKKEDFIFKDMQALKILNHKCPHKTVIKGKVGKRAFVISGFDGMEAIKKIILEQGLEAQEKDQKIDWSSPLVMALSLIVSTALLVMVISFGHVFFEFFTSIVQISLGLSLIFARPISKSSGMAFRKLELILGLLLTTITLGLMIFQQIL